MIEPMYNLVEKGIQQAEAEKDKRKFYREDICLLTLLKGVCLKYMNLPLQAEECFAKVSSHRGVLSRDTYLVPYAMYEQALLLKDQGTLTDALNLLEKTK